LSGHHANVARWRRDQALRRTARRRPDLIQAAADRLSERDRAALSDAAVHTPDGQCRQP
jgi:tRNA (guanine37-N1)-methyltransferase